METGLVDLNGIVIKEGQFIVFQSEYLEDKPTNDYVVYKVKFDFGAFVGIKQYSVYNGKRYSEENYKPGMSDYGVEVLRDYIDTVSNGYVSNYGETHTFENNVVKGWVIEE